MAKHKGTHHLDNRASDLAAQIPNNDDLLSTKQLAHMLGVSDQWVELGRHRGYGPQYIKLSERRIRYRRCDVVNWLNSRTRIATEKFASA